MPRPLSGAEETPASRQRRQLRQGRSGKPCAARLPLLVSRFVCRFPCYHRGLWRLMGERVSPKSMPVPLSVKDLNSAGGCRDFGGSEFYPFHEISVSIVSLFQSLRHDLLPSRYIYYEGINCAGQRNHGQNGCKCCRELLACVKEGAQSLRRRKPLPILVLPKLVKSIINNSPSFETAARVVLYKPQCISIGR